MVNFKKFIFEKENICWIFLSLFFAVVSLFFISLEVKNSSAEMLLELKKIYLAYLFGAFLFSGFLFYLFGKSISNNYLIRKLLLTLLPTELILLFGFWSSPYFNTVPFYHLFKIAVNLYPLLA